MRLNAKVLTALCAATGFAPHALAQPSIPAEFDTPGATLDRLFTVGGVTGFIVTESAQSVYQGGSLQVDIGFNDGGFFTFQSVGLGAQAVSAAAFAVQPGADTFSITIQAPAVLSGGLRLLVTLRDDDNLDSIIDLNDDDEWLSDPIPLSTGLAVYNVPLAAFTDSNPGDGDDTPNLGSGLAGTMILTIETTESMAGGRLIEPVTLHIDHAGAYLGNQSIPDGGACNVADLADPLGTLDFSDVLAFLAAFGAQDPAADLAPPTGVFDFTDVIAFLGAFGVGCP